MSANRKQVVTAIERLRLPAVYANNEFANAGGLLAYAPDLFDRFRRAAIFVDKILKGTKPADIPIERPTTFEFAINMGTAAALGVTVSSATRLRADRVIE